MELRKAERKAAKIKLGIQGPSGSGKTYSALLLAHGLVLDWSKIAVIDTENHSSELYSHLGKYNVLHLEKFNPEEYASAIDVCEKANMEIIIIDSISHAWETLLEIHGSMTGNSFTNWSRITPRQNRFIQRILQSPAHIICTMRSKTDYVLSEKNGKMVPERVGMKSVARDGTDYEFTILFELDYKHFCTAPKDRTGLFGNLPQFLITQETGEKIKHWCSEGVSTEDVVKQIYGAVTLE